MIKLIILGKVIEIDYTKEQWIRLDQSERNEEIMHHIYLEEIIEVIIE